MTEAQDAYDAEIRRMNTPGNATSGWLSDSIPTPRGPYGGQLTTDKMDPRSPITTRLSNLALQISKVGLQVVEARDQARSALAHKEKCEAQLAQVTDDLMRVINEIREGTRENVPYQP